MAIRGCTSADLDVAIHAQGDFSDEGEAVEHELGVSLSQLLKDLQEGFGVDVELLEVEDEVEPLLLQGLVLECE